jgi:RimJ/RimL family protein N-acetyltransferase
MSNIVNKNDIFLRGEHVILKALNENDVLNTNWYGWFNDEDTTQFMQKHYFPNTLEKQMTFLENLNKDDTKLQLGICDIKNGVMFGVISLQQIDFINRKAETAMIIGEANYRKLIYSTEAIELIIKHAFEVLNLIRIYGGTTIYEWAEALCRFLGFKREGILRQDVFKNGAYHDVYLIGLLKEELILGIKKGE